MSKEKRTHKLPLIAFATLPLTVGLVLAQQSSVQTGGTATDSGVTAQGQPQRVQPIQPGQRNQNQGNTQNQQNQQNQAPRQFSGTNYADEFLKKLAAGLGISVDKLKAAAIAAGSATIDQGVKAGDFPADMAQNMKQRLQTEPFSLGGGRGFGGPGRHGPDGDDDGFGGPRGHHGFDQNQNAAGQDSSDTSDTSATTPQDGV